MAYETFISGETIDLVVPDEQAITDGWASWFNDKRVTRYLNQGLYPHYLEDQEAFLDSLRRKERFCVAVCDKESRGLLGVISLSAIDLVTSSAQISLVVPVAARKHPLAALEAMARVTEHGFQAFGLKRIWAGQAYPGLRKWNQRLEILGYRTEGVVRGGFRKGLYVEDSVVINVLQEDYLRLVAARGELWPGAEKVREILRKLPKESLADILHDQIRRTQEEYMAMIDGICGDGS